MTLTAKFGAAATIPFGGGAANVAVNDSGKVVAVTLGTSSIEYAVGTIDLAAQTVSFPAVSSTAYTWSKPAVSYVDVAMDGNNVVLVFQIGGGGNELYYQTGTLNGSSITWSKAVNYDSGQHPCVAINGSTVIEVDNSATNAYEMYYHKGTLQGSTISNFDQREGFDDSTAPVSYTSCVSSDNNWLVVTANGGFATLGETSYFSANSMNCKVVNSGTVAPGTSTSLAWYSWGILLEVHGANPQSFDGTNIFLAIGTIDGNQNDKSYGEITWQNPNQDTKISGMSPYIAAAGNYAIMTYYTPGSPHTTQAVCISQAS